MTREKFIRLTGWGMVLAAISLQLTHLTDPAKIQVGLNRIFGVPASPSQSDLYGTLSEGVGGLPFLVAILLITLGLVGLRTRYSEQAGHTAKLALGIGVLGGTAGVVSNIWMVSGFENGRTLMNNSMAFMFAGMFVFGLVAMKKKPMPRWNGLPVLAGFWWPFIVIGANIYHYTSGHWLGVPGWLSFTLFFIMSFFLALLGYVLQADLPKEKVVAPLPS